MSYAEETRVSVEKTRAEIESLLSRAGAVKFGYMTETKGAAIACVLNNRSLRFLLPLPDRADRVFRFTPHRNVRRNDAEAYNAWEQACRSRWRGLYLCIRAKIEAVQVGISTFEEEFLAHFVLSDGRTVGQSIIPQLNECAGSGLLLLPERAI